MAVIKASGDTAATTATSIGVWINVTRNDSDKNGYPLSVTSVDQSGIQGLVGINPRALNGVWYEPNGAFNYLSAGETATTTFTYTVSDGHGSTDSAPVTVTVSGVNQPPTANPDTATMSDTAKGVWIDVTSNDTDPNRDDTLSVTSVDQNGTKGTVSINDGALNGVWYSPGTAFDYLTAGQTATDRFGYTISDGHGGTSTSYATVTITGSGTGSGGGSGTPPPPTRGFYVATNGNDGWSGRLAAPNADRTDGPFASLARAQKAMVSDGSTKATYVEGGSYAATLNLIGRDSGETWSNYNGQTVYLHGGYDSHVFGIYGANNVTLSGLTMDDPSNGSGYAVQISGASNVTVKNSVIENSETGIAVNSGSSHITISDNEFKNLDGTGIMITPGANYVTATGNNIHDVGIADVGSGIWFNGSSNDTFSNNTITTVGKFGIGGGSVLGRSDASYNDVITRNTITNANHVYPDAGAIDLIGDQQDNTGDTISYNTITGTSSGNTSAWIGPGIYLDDFTSGVTVYGNLLQNNIEGIWVHLGSDNTIDDNVVTSSKLALAMDGNNETGIRALHAPTGNEFKNNSAYFDDTSAFSVYINDAISAASWDNNVYGGPLVGSTPFHVDSNHVTVDKTFSQWQALGFDTTSPAPSTSMTVADAVSRLPSTF